jgi:transposase
VLDVRGAVVERRVLGSDAFERWAARLPASNVVMEACGSVHHWGRWFAARGHTARFIAAEYVVPFRKGGKNDTSDAEAIAIANKHARILWAMLAKGERYDASACRRHPMNQPSLAGNA